MVWRIQPAVPLDNADLARFRESRRPNRGGPIRTAGHRVPNAVLYQAELRPGGPQSTTAGAGPRYSLSGATGVVRAAGRQRGALHGQLESGVDHHEPGELGGEHDAVGVADPRERAAAATTSTPAPIRRLANARSRRTIERTMPASSASVPTVFSAIA